MIRVQQLRFTYPKQNTPVLKGLDFEIAQGEIFGFLGPSGSGKSTTQKVLIGLLTKYEGEIHIDGKNFSAWGREYYEEIGVGFELPNHFGKLTALENLKLFSSFYQKPCQDHLQLLQQVGLQDAAHQLVVDFSKGMKMRLNFVRAIQHNPNILFFDEPTSGLDPLNARKLKDIILSLKEQGKTIFLTTHNMYDAEELCDRVAFIVEGEIKALDSPRNLKLNHGQSKVVVEYKEEDGVNKKVFDLDNLGANQDFLTILQSNKLQTIHSQEATLENVFIETTGRSLK